VKHGGFARTVKALSGAVSADENKPSMSGIFIPALVISNEFENIFPNPNFLPHFVA